MNGCCKTPVHQQCMIYFSFFTTGDSFWMLHTRFRRGAATITFIVYQVCDCIYQVLQPIYMSPPPSEEDWKQIEHRFNTKWNFPKCIGSLDGKHIIIIIIIMVFILSFQVHSRHFPCNLSRYCIQKNGYEGLRINLFPLGIAQSQHLCVCLLN